MPAMTKIFDPITGAWLIGAFVFCFFAEGAIWWTGSYRDYLERDLIKEMFLLLAGVSMLLAWIVGKGIVGVCASAIVVGSTFPVVILVRVFLVDIDPTDHNLWPFEVVIAYGYAMAIAAPSAAIGGLLRWITHRQRV